MKKFVISIIILLVCVISAPVFAGSLPYNIGNIEGFLENDTYFNGYEIIENKDFSGEWFYTAIGFESGHFNITKEEAGESEITFTTQNYNNFGDYDTINFDDQNLLFQDSDGPVDIALDPYENNHYFKLFQLTADSNALSYLDSNLILGAGTIIVGFNDNGWLPVGDSDYDDIIVALNPAAPVPEPATMFLLGIGLVGLAGFKRKKG